MGFLQLFYVASLPVIKVLLVSAIGLFLALDNINLLGEDSRKKVNHIVFYVFNPSLVGGSLASTLTRESIVLLWFMPINILSTFILGSALGWILIKITRPPKHMEGLVLGCCSAGNLGNLLIIIIPAICKEKGSPFGEPDVCNQYGMAYASLSMAIGAIFIWSYVYNIMRISANKVHKEVNTSNDHSILKGSEEISESQQDTYTILLSNTECEEKVPFSVKVKKHLRMISDKFNFASIFAPSTIGAIIGFIIGVIPQIRNLLIGNDAPLHVIEDSATMLGNAAVPTLTLILGANLLKGLRGTSNPPLWTVIGIIVVRYILLPLMGIGVVKGAIYLGLVQPNPLYQFVLLLQYALPPAMNIGTIAQLFGAGESECSVIMLWTYALASVAVTFWSTYFLWLLS
ncbi:PREDICTED: protein PIN-LIKES 3-like isoform X2 [Lupinus angustifolius]|uniref:protein PIN-LIKES 3-like isoform X2 n=1 Tax=Lupinus angustifolius TaxID=3871 RepID=UPI00092EB2F7|nr:PREDICTED: protein PIN-LIKES 3-like isoform X2 [Lupinus angustifolius]